MRQIVTLDELYARARFVESLVPTPSKRQSISGLIVCLAISFAAAAIGAVASVHAKTLYDRLVQPAWAPPATVFGPVWTILYALMGIAAWLVWRAGGFRTHRRTAALFLVQLSINAIWSWLFFAWHRGALAFVDILVLWVLVAATMICFWRVDRFAASLLVPYLSWISFAAALAYSVWQRNPQVFG